MVSPILAFPSFCACAYGTVRILDRDESFLSAAFSIIVRVWISHSARAYRCVFL